MSAPEVTLKNIGLTIAGQKVLNEISIELKKGEITTLIGPNGGGKTSIARIVLGIIKPTNGKVIKNGKVKFGYMPQKISLDKTLPINALDFIHLSVKKVQTDKEFKKIIHLLNVENLLDKQIHDLSGGQLQKILLLRSIINKPDLLVLDEPTQYMDIAAIENFYQVIDEVRKINKCTILLISHDLNLVMQKTDTVFCVNRHVCCHGSPESINNHPEYLSLFGAKTNLAIYQHHHNHKH